MLPIVVHVEESAGPSPLTCTHSLLIVGLFVSLVAEFQRLEHLYVAFTHCVEHRRDAMHVGVETKIFSPVATRWLCELYRSYFSGCVVATAFNDCPRVCIDLFGGPVLISARPRVLRDGG